MKPSGHPRSACRGHRAQNRKQRHHRYDEQRYDEQKKRPALLGESRSNAGLNHRRLLSSSPANSVRAPFEAPNRACASHPLTHSRQSDVQAHGFSVESSRSGVRDLRFRVYPPCLRKFRHTEHRWSAPRSEPVRSCRPQTRSRSSWRIPVVAWKRRQRCFSSFNSDLIQDMRAGGPPDVACNCN